MKNFIFCLLVGAMTFVLVSCKNVPDQQRDMFDQQQSYSRTGAIKSGPLTNEEAIEIAKREAIRRNVGLEHYAEPSATGPEAGKWFIFFGEKPPCPGCAPALGSHFAISIDENDETTFYSPGR